MRTLFITVMGIGTLYLMGCQTAFECGGMVDSDKAVVTTGADE